MLVAVLLFIIPRRIRLGGEEEELSMVTAAQFIYISLFPTLLNQVHANNASPLGAKLGIVKSYVVVIGQPPIIDLITLNVAPLS